MRQQPHCGRHAQRHGVHLGKESDACCALMAMRPVGFRVLTPLGRLCQGFGGYGRLGHAEQKDEMRPRALKNIGNRPGTGCVRVATHGQSHACFDGTA
eukprot:scaffold1718_cov363-Prasinococcus_capsulatus_cf.AAC.4